LSPVCKWRNALANFPTGYSVPFINRSIGIQYIWQMTTGYWQSADKYVGFAEVANSL
jgi:hypothetical protein